MIVNPLNLGYQYEGGDSADGIAAKVADALPKP